jgi:transposase InsO family protein
MVDPSNCAFCSGCNLAIDWASAYRSAEIEAKLEEKGLKSRIHRKGHRNKPLSERESLDFRCGSQPVLPITGENVGCWVISRHKSVKSRHHRQNVGSWGKSGPRSERPELRLSQERTRRL